MVSFTLEEQEAKFMVLTEPNSKWISSCDGYFLTFFVKSDEFPGDAVLINDWTIVVPEICVVSILDDEDILQPLFPNLLLHLIPRVFCWRA